MIADGSVLTAHYAAASIVPAALADDAVVAAKLATGSVTTDAIRKPIPMNTPLVVDAAKLGGLFIIAQGNLRNVAKQGGGLFIRGGFIHRNRTDLLWTLSDPARFSKKCPIFS